MAGWRSGTFICWLVACRIVQVPNARGSSFLDSLQNREGAQVAIPWCVQIAGLIAFVLLLSPRLDFWYVFDLVLIIETSRLRSEGL